MDKLKILIGLAIIVASFVYVLRNNTSMLDNLMKKSKEEYEKKQAIKEKAYQVVDGQADAFDTIVEGVKSVTKKDTRKDTKKDMTNDAMKKDG